MRRTWWAAAALATSLVATPATAAPGEAVWVPTRPNASWAFASGGMTAFADGTVVALLRHDTIVSATLLRSRDHGATWTEHEATADGLNLVWLQTPTRSTAMAFAVPAERADGYGHSQYAGSVLATTDGMRTWRRYAVPRRPGAADFGSTGFAASPSGRAAVLAGTTMGTFGVPFDPGAELIFVSDRGRTVRRAHVGTGPGTGAVPVLADDDTAVVAVRETLTLPGTPELPCCPETTTVLWRTDDAGATWRRLATIQDEVLSLDWPRPGLLMLGSGRTGAVYESRDGGRTVTRLGAVALPVNQASPRTHPPVLDIDFVDDRRGFAATCQAGMWSTRDGGRSWELEPSPNHGNVYTYPVCSPDSIAGADFDHAVGWYFGGMLSRRLTVGG